jgi:chitinase
MKTPTYQTDWLKHSLVYSSLLLALFGYDIAKAAPKDINIDYQITQDWGSGHQGMITLTNTGNEPLNNFVVAFDTPHKITSLWNGQHTAQADHHTIMHPSWKTSLAPGESYSFGFIGAAVGSEPLTQIRNVQINGVSLNPSAQQPPVVEPPVVEPENPVVTSPVTEDNVDYSKVNITHRITSDWGSGFNGEIIITNKSNVSIKGYRLVFMGPGEGITSMWNHSSLSTVGNTHTVTTDANHWNGTIAPGASITIGFGGKGKATAITGCTINQMPCVLTDNTPIAEPPVVDDPVVNPEPPVTEPEDPVVDPEPPVTEPEDPIINPEPPVTTHPGSKKIIGYYAGWATYGRDYQVADIPASKLTHINYAFLNVVNGQCVIGDSYADLEKRHSQETSPDGKVYAAQKWYYAPGEQQPAYFGNFGRLQQLKQLYPHVKTLLAIGGWTWSGGFHDAAKDSASRAKLINSCVGIMEQYGFDGLDYDWEYPASDGLQAGYPEDKQRFTLLLQETKQKLDQLEARDHRDYYLSAALPAGVEKANKLELNKIHQYLDWLNIMTYDLNGAWSDKVAHQTALYPSASDPACSDTSSAACKLNIDDAVKNYLAAGTPPEKIIIGGAFYGRAWGNVTDNGAGGLFTNNAAPFGKCTWEDDNCDYWDIKNKIASGGFREYFDASSSAAYAYNASTRQFITYDNPQSLTNKANYVKAKNLGGMMLWELSGDTHQDNSNMLLTAMHDNLKNSQG